MAEKPSQNSDLPKESDKARFERAGDAFHKIDVDKDGRITVSDLKTVLKKIKAPKYYINNAESILWEVSDNNLHGYVTKKDVQQLVARVAKDVNGHEPHKLVNIIDFISRDPEMTGYISARDCIMLIHNRFGGDASSVELRNLFVNNQNIHARISFKEFINQVKMRGIILRNKCKGVH